MSDEFTNIIDIEPLLNDLNVVLKNGINKVFFHHTVKKLNKKLNECQKQMEFYKKELCLARKYYKQTSLPEMHVDSEPVPDPVSDFDSDSEIELISESESPLIKRYQIILKAQPVETEQDKLDEEVPNENECIATENIEFSKNEEHISLNIEDISENNSVVSMDNILDEVNVNGSNIQIKQIIFDTEEKKDSDDEDEDEDDEDDEEEDDEDEDDEEEDDEDEEEKEEDEAEEAEEAEEEKAEEAEAEEAEAEEDEDDEEEKEGEDQDDDIETENSDSEEEEIAEELEPLIEKVEDVEDEDEEVFEIEIDDVTYYATSEENGPLYEVDESGDPGKKVGYLKDGEAIFL